MSYRSDLDAAHARADAAERRAAELQKQLDAKKPPRDERARVPIPERFHVDEGGDSLSIRWRWFSGHHVFMLFFVIAWDAFLVFWYSHAATDHAPWIFKVFPIVHVAVGVGLTYSVLTGFLNSTTVTARLGKLVVRHGPLPWRGNRMIAASDLEQLYVIENRHIHHHDHDHHRYHTSTRLTYDVCAIARGKQLKLLRKLPSHDQALYIEHALERHLGIEDRAVPGEMPKR